VEYKDKKATQIYVKFPVRDFSVMSGHYDPEIEGDKMARGMSLLRESSIVIWTTTPWTIPANRAVSYSKNIKYLAIRVDELDSDLPYAPWAKVGEQLIVARDLLPNVMIACGIKGYTALPVFVKPEDVISEEDCAFSFPSGNMTLSHPLKNMADAEGKYDFPVPLLEGSHVTADAGTGFVHTAPSHGEDDYVVWISNQTKLENLRIDPVVPMTLDDAGCYTDVMPSRFQGLDVIRTSGKKRGQDGKANGEVLNRIGTMVADRPDWLISRQRNWGVPITLIVGPNGELHTHRDDADAINSRILAAVEKVGVDGWFETPLEEFMPDNNEGWSKVTDILDVWFDSGSTHAFCLKRRDDLKDRADLYLEGSDQHRGWFQSSLLESCAVYGEAPYDGVLTHGFVVDEKGLKMSKSLGNTMSPEEINKQYGAEIMRIWKPMSMLIVSSVILCAI